MKKYYFFFFFFLSFLFPSFFFSLPPSPLFFERARNNLILYPRDRVSSSYIMIRGAYRSIVEKKKKRKKEKRKKIKGRKKCEKREYVLETIIITYTGTHFFFCPVIYIFFPPSLFSKYFRTVSIYTFSTRSRNHRIEGHYFPSKRDSSATIDTSAYFSSFSILAWHDRERMRGQMTALPAFETLLTLRILARRARLTPLYPVENDDITIKLPSAYGN